MAIKQTTLADQLGQVTQTATARPTGAGVDQGFDDLLGTLGGGRINDFLNLGIDSNDTEGLLATIHGLFTEVARVVRRPIMEVRVYALPSSEQSPDSRLAYPAVVATVRIKNEVMMTPFFIVPGRMGSDFEQLTVRHGAESLSVPRHPSEAADARAMDDFRAVICADQNVPPEAVYVKDCICINDISQFTADEETAMRAARKMLLPAIRIAATAMLITVQGLIEDVSLVKNVDRSKSRVAIGYRTLDDLYYDDDGLPVGGNLKATVRVENLAGDSSNSLNKSQGNYTVGSTVVRASIVHASGQGGMNPLFAPPGAIRPPMFTPQLILDDIRIDGDPSPANLALMLASTIPVFNPEVIRRLYDAKDIGYLNTRANLNGDGKPFAEKDVRANFPAIWNGFFTNSVVVSVCVRYGALSSLYSSIFLRNGKNKEGVGEVKAGMQSLLSTKFEGLANSPRFPGIELIPIGTYKGEGGQISPLSDIDLLWLIRNCSNRPQLIDQWAMSSDGTRDPNTALAIKLNVLRVVTNGTMKVIDRGAIVTLSPDYLQAMSYGLSRSQVPITTNLSTLTGMDQNRWAPYLSAGQSLDLSTFIPFTGSAGQGAYGQYGYTEQQPNSGYSGVYGN